MFRVREYLIKHFHNIVPKETTLFLSAHKITKNTARQHCAGKPEKTRVTYECKLLALLFVMQGHVFSFLLIMRIKRPYLYAVF